MNLTAVIMFSRLSVVAIVLLAPCATHAEGGDWFATGSIVHNGDSPFSLRTEFRLRKAFDSGDRNFTDFIGILGLQYSFGGGTEEPEVIPLINDAPVPPADTDNDGVPDSIDLCPGTPADADVDTAGCEKMHIENARFDTESAVLDSSAMRTLDDIATLLARNPDVQVEVAGHADSRGPEDYNMRLSANRAEAVRDYLAQKGIAASRMTVRGYGEAQPTASNDSAQGQAENRRVELRVTNR